MRNRVRTILITTAFLLIVLIVAVVPVSAQGSGGRVYFGVLYDPVFHVPDETSGAGAHFDVSRKLVERTTTRVFAVGEVGFNTFDSGTIASFLGGGRVAAQINPKMSPFFQFLFGAQHCCDSTDLAFQPGIGFDYAWLAKVTVRAQIDFRRVFYDGGSESETRLSFGIVIPLRVD